LLRSTRRTRCGVAVDGEHLGVFGVEAGERVGVTPLDGASESLKIQPTSRALFGHTIPFN
jgi:hypothetical protein